MTPDAGRRTQDNFRYKRMIWPYYKTVYEDGRIEIDLQNAICPRCRARATTKQNGDTVTVECRRCRISEDFSPFDSYEELKEHVKGELLASLGA
jgi:hypothetical protein